MDPKINDESRRPLAARQSALTQRIAVRINNRDITPNQISLMSIVFAALGFAAMLGYHFFRIKCAFTGGGSVYSGASAV